MHECPDCGMDCDRDQDDTWFENMFVDCNHECDEEDDPDCGFVMDDFGDFGDQ